MPKRFAVCQIGEGKVWESLGLIEAEQCAKQRIAFLRVLIALRPAIVRLAYLMMHPWDLSKLSCRIIVEAGRKCRLRCRFYTAR